MIKMRLSAGLRPDPGKTWKLHLYNHHHQQQQHQWW